MTNTLLIQKRITDAIELYVETIDLELFERWDAWKKDLDEQEKFESIGGLLARQVTLATQLATNPPIWNAHIAPIILRSMVDTFISLAWILEDPLDRAREFVLYGLGQEKLILEHQKQAIREAGDNPDEDLYVQHVQEMLDSQRYTFLTEVNLGSWSGRSTRKMAEEAGCIDIYNFAYLPFSAATHGAWNQIFRYNLTPCQNPLHRYHLVPYNPELDPDPDYLYRAAKYVDKSFRLFDAKTGVKCTLPSAFADFESALESLSAELHAQSDEPLDTDDE